METISKVRRAYFIQQKPIKAICREFRLSRRLVRNVIRSEATEFHYERRQQPLPQHVTFAERFGPIDVNRFFATVPGYPMIAEVRKEPEQRLNIGNGWHTDHSYDEVPALGSMLYAREVPKTGGDTLYASMYAAYDALSDGLKATLEGLRAGHSSRHIFGPEGGRGAAISPAVSAIPSLRLRTR